MSVNKSASARHAVSIEGTGDNVIVFGHGYGCDQTVWQKIRPAFSQITRTVAFDITGAGKSDLSHFDARGRHADLDGYASDLIEICEELDAKSITFIGHSVGAMIGLIAAAQRPQLFKSQVLIAPSPCYLNQGDYRGGFDQDQLDGLLDLMGDNFSNWADIVTPIIMKNTEKPALATALSKSFCRWDEAIAKHFARLTFLSDSREVLPRIAVNCLIIQCTDDALAPEFVGTYMSGAINASSVVHLQARGHCPHVSQPEEAIDVIMHYLYAAGG